MSESISIAENLDPTDIEPTTASDDQAFHGEPKIAAENQNRIGEPDPYGGVLFFASMLGEIEFVRISNENRLRSVQQLNPVETLTPEVGFLAERVEDLIAMEKKIAKNLEGNMARTPIGKLIKHTTGLGLKSVGRFLGEVGNPSWHRLYDRPRRLGELYAFCGLDVRDGKAPKLMKGVQCNWSTKAKTKAYVIADVAARRGNYRDLYVRRRARTEESHSDWTKLHSHNDGLRIVSKAIIKDIWLVSQGERPVLGSVK